MDMVKADIFGKNRSMAAVQKKRLITDSIF